MARRLPSLTALRSFEAAARHLSFKLAATELCVTPAAIGFQIRQLEDELGHALFLRRHRAVELTDRGQRLLRDLDSVFHRIDTAWQAAHDRSATRVLNVTGPARAVRGWILPALRAARVTQPDVTISWDLSRETRDLLGAGMDMGVRWAREPTGDLHWEPVLHTWFTPLMRPDTARQVRKARDLERQGLIDVEFPPDRDMTESTWAGWFRVNGLDAAGRFAISCADTAAAVEMAIATGHVAIGGSFLAADALASGLLLAPFDSAIRPNSRFWLVARPGLQETEDYAWFRDAIRAGAAALDVNRPARLFSPDGSPVPN